MNDEFDTRKAKIVDRLTEAIRDLSELYANHPEQVAQCVDEPTATITVFSRKGGETAEIVNAFPVSSQHTSWDADRDAYIWGPVVYCVFGVSRGELPIH